MNDHKMNEGQIMHTMDRPSYERCTEARMRLEEVDKIQKST
jgi:hypothetical protein